MFNSKFFKILLVVSAIINVFLLIRYMYCNSPCSLLVASSSSSLSPASRLTEPELNKLSYSKRLSSQNEMLDSIIFVGGVPRSGTTLMRTMLDAHPEVRCGEETRVLPRIISMRSKWGKAGKEHERLQEAGLNDKKLDEATKAFVNYIILNHGEDAPHLCNKDPLLLNYMEILQRLYPRSKFILMIRDGRAVAYSIVSRNVTITGVNNKDYFSAALFWNRVVQRMTGDCRALGEGVCLQVRYEELVANPRDWMSRILAFLNVPWHENVLQHEKFINNGISLSRWVCLCVLSHLCSHFPHPFRLEPSSNQVKQPVHTSARDKWRENLPSSLQDRIYSECNMLRELNYPR